MAQRLLCILPLAALLGLLFGSEFALQDLSIYWKACSQWIAGHSAYALPHQSGYVQGWGGIDAAFGETLAVWSAPIFLVPASIFGIWELATAKSIYLAATCFVVGAFTLSIRDSIRLLIKQTGQGGEVLVKVVGPTVLFPLPPLLEHLSWGGMSVLSALAVVLLVTFKDRGFVLWLIALLLFALKPHPCALLVLGWFAGARREEQRTMLWAFVVASALLILPIVLEPMILFEFLKLDLTIPFFYQNRTATLTGILRGFEFVPVVSFALGTSLLSLILVSILKNKTFFTSEELPWLMMLLSPLSVFLCPYAWGHDYFICGGWAASIFFFKLYDRPLGFLGLILLPLSTLSMLESLRDTLAGPVTGGWWAIFALSLYLDLIGRRQAIARAIQI
jgi:hypothetical protein